MFPKTTKISEPDFIKINAKTPIGSKLSIEPPLIAEITDPFELDTVVGGWRPGPREGETDIFTITFTGTVTFGVNSDYDGDRDS